MTRENFLVLMKGIRFELGDNFGGTDEAKVQQMIDDSLEQASLCDDFEIVPAEELEE